MFRKMINEYMCSNFVAEEILTEVAPAQFFQTKENSSDSKGKHIFIFVSLVIKYLPI